MKRLLLAGLLAFLFGFHPFASPGGDSTSPSVNPEQNPAPPQSGPIAKHLSAIRLEDGTPVKLRLRRTISSADALVDDQVGFDVREEIRINDLVVIPKGSVAWGTVTEAKQKRRMARSGKLSVSIDAVRLADGEKAALRAVKDVKGRAHKGLITGAMVGAGRAFPPTAPLFLLAHGKDATIPKGREVTAYIDGDFSIDLARFGAASTIPTAPASALPAAGVANGSSSGPPTVQPATPPQPAEPSIIVFMSTPDGAEITLDGKFVGNTPSSMRLGPGDHSISIEKSGFKTWLRTVSISAGANITIDPTLEKTR